MSSSSTLPLILIHCFPFVTPGLLPVLALFLPVNELINVDLPTLGIPTIIALMERFLIPLSLSLSILAEHAAVIRLLTARLLTLSLELSLRQ